MPRLALWASVPAGYSIVMSAENVKVVTAMYESRERGDMDVGEFVHPEIVFARIGSPSFLARPANGMALTECGRPPSSI